MESKTGKKSGSGKGRPKKQKINYEDLSKEELIKIIKIREEFYDILEKKKKTRPRDAYAKFQYICKKHSVSIAWLCSLFGVSKSGYYAWVKEPKVGRNVNVELFAIIKTEHELHKGVWGVERIWGALLCKGIEVNIKTVRVYLRLAGLKCKLRQSRRRREIKDMIDKRKNLINKNFVSDSKVKVFSDSSQWNLPKETVYISAVVSENYVYDVKASLRNDAKLVTDNIESACRKIGSKFIIHFDNAAFYKTVKMEQMVAKYKGIQSFNEGDDPLDNRPVEYSFSIFKNEYFRVHNPKDFKEFQELIPKMVFDFNHRRIQKRLDWKTPTQWAGV